MPVIEALLSVIVQAEFGFFTVMIRDGYVPSTVKQKWTRRK
jgi:hypothetical protein